MILNDCSKIFIDLEWCWTTVYWFPSFPLQEHDRTTKFFDCWCKNTTVQRFPSMLKDFERPYNGCHRLKKLNNMFYVSNHTRAQVPFFTNKLGSVVKGHNLCNLNQRYMKQPKLPTKQCLHMSCSGHGRMSWFKTNKCCGYQDSWPGARNWQRPVLMCRWVSEIKPSHMCITIKRIMQNLSSNAMLKMQ